MACARSDHTGRLLGEPGLELGALVAQLVDVGVVVAGDGQKGRAGGAPAPSGGPRRQRQSPGPGGRCPRAGRPRHRRPRASSATMSPGSPIGRIGEVDDLVADHQRRSAGRPSSMLTSRTDENLRHAPVLHSAPCPISDAHSPPTPRDDRLRGSDRPGHRVLVGHRCRHRPSVRGAGRHRGRQLVDIRRGRARPWPPSSPTPATSRPTWPTRHRPGG